MGCWCVAGMDIDALHYQIKVNKHHGLDLYDLVAIQLDFTA